MCIVSFGQSSTAWTIILPCSHRLHEHLSDSFEQTRLAFSLDLEPLFASKVVVVDRKEHILFELVNMVNLFLVSLRFFLQPILCRAIGCMVCSVIRQVKYILCCMLKCIVCHRTLYCVCCSLLAILNLFLVKLIQCFGSCVCSSMKCDTKCQLSSTNAVPSNSSFEVSHCVYDIQII